MYTRDIWGEFWKPVNGQRSKSRTWNNIASVVTIWKLGQAKNFNYRAGRSEENFSLTGGCPHYKTSLIETSCIEKLSIWCYHYGMAMLASFWGSPTVQIVIHNELCCTVSLKKVTIYFWKVCNYHLKLILRSLIEFCESWLTLIMSAGKGWATPTPMPL